MTDVLGTDGVRCCHGVRLDYMYCSICDIDYRPRKCTILDCPKFSRPRSVCKSSSNYKLMTRWGVCFFCAFWFEKVQWQENNDPTVVRVESEHYRYAADPPEGFRGFVGFGGRPWVIKFLDGRVVKTKNLWRQGTIPSWFRELLPDNAQFDYTDHNI